MTDTFATTASVTLIAPGVGTALRQSRQDMPGNDPSGEGRPAGESRVSAVDALSLLAGRGAVRLAWNRRTLSEAQLRTWQRGLLEVLHLEPRDYASAPVSALGDGVADQGIADQHSYWLHAELVHLAAGLDRLTFLPLTGVAAVAPAEREALAPLIAQHLQDASLQLVRGASGAWLLRSQRPLELQTATPEAAVANELDVVMPSGPAAGEVRRVMTECQMLLHDHEVNQRRQRRGLPAINAVWPWGGGPLATLPARPPTASLPAMFSDDAFVRGIYRLHAQEIAALPTQAATAIDAAAARKRPVIAVVAADSPAALRSAWAEPLVSALRAGHLQRLDLLLDEWHIHATRSMLRRFWRKPSPPSAWPT